MTWEAVGAVGSLVGGIGVAVSLVYLGIQIRNQNREAQVASVHEILKGFREEISAFTNAELAELQRKGSHDFAALSDTEKIQFIARVQGVLRFWEEAFHQYKRNRLSEQMWDGINLQLRDFFSTDGSRKVWELRGHTYSEEFRAHMDSIEPGVYRIE